MHSVNDNVKEIVRDFKAFFRELFFYISKLLRSQFEVFETHKGVFVGSLYRQRGKMARRLTHSGMAGLAALGVMIAPAIAKEFPGRSVNPWDVTSSPAVLSLTTSDTNTSTFISSERDQIIDYTVASGDTVSTIAEKFGISTDTIRWQNNLKSKDSIRDGEVLQILPVTGIAHKVQKGDTIYSIAKKYDVDPQAIVNFPFNTYANDETFDLAIGQILVVPGGEKKDEPLWFTPTQPKFRQITPDAGSVVASGNFAWPTSGIITQYFVWYHPGLDIANPAAPLVLAADSGKVIAAGWDSTGYGNKVMVDHGNGYRTLYGHLQKIFVVVGQTVGRGNQLGQMGSTGRSTGTHLHFEIYQNGVRVNPLKFLK